MHTLFDNIPTVYLIYIFYGGAFLFLSAAIAMKDLRASDLKLARILWLLGMFGLTHGVHELLQIYPLIVGESLTLQNIYHVRAVSLGFFLMSYLFLLQFGSSLVRATHYRRTRWLSGLPVVLFLLWIAYLAYRGFTMDLQFLRQAAIGARYTFGLASTALTAYGLVIYSRELIHLSRSVSKKLRYAGITFGFYCVFAGIFSSDLAQYLLPMPVEVLRGLSAIFITYFIIKALNIFDIETRKNIEQQARLIVQSEKLTSLGQLAAGMAHEINNPLTNASLSIQLMRTRLKNNNCSEASALEKLDSIERNIDRASVIARELLQFSRQKEPAFAPLNINTVIRGALTLLQYKLKGIVIRQDLEDLPEVMGDPGKLEQVFINILSNAADAMNGGTISIRTMRLDAGVRVRIEDTGEGIAEKNLIRVFDPFFTTKEPGTGTGLGLSICYGIIKDHQGTIDIVSKVNKGTTVTITIPERARYETLTRR